MAYLDLDNFYATPVASRTMRTSAPIESGFSALEWSVIALAKRDPLRSLATPGRVARAIRRLFGLGVVSRLADERLEALRRLAVFAWRRGFAVPATEIEHSLAAGFTHAQIETLVRSITGVTIDA